MRKILLDTNAYSALAVGNGDVLEEIEKAHQVIMSPICIGELVAGFIKGSKEAKNRSMLAKFLEQPTIYVAPITSETAEWYAIIFSRLQKNGAPIPINDVWIAAQSQEHGAQLITQDQHFQTVPGLNIWKFR